MNRVLLLPVTALLGSSRPIVPCAQIFFAFENCKHLVGEDFTPAEREIAELELTHELLTVLGEHSSDGKLGARHIDALLRRMSSAGIAPSPSAGIAPSP